MNKHRPVLMSAAVEKKNARIFDLYCELSTCGGVVDWHNAKSAAGKYFWAVLVALALIVTICQTIGTFNEYRRQAPYQTTMSLENDATGIKFPNITICNFNRAKRSLVNRTDLDPNVLTYVFTLFPVAYDIFLNNIVDDSKKIQTIRAVETAWREYVSNGGISDVFEFLNFYAHTYDETVLDVSLGGFPESNVTYERVYTSYGMCYKLILNTRLLVSGTAYGVTVRLNPHLDEYLRNVIYANFLQQGFAVGLHYVDDPYMTSPIFLRPGISANIAIRTIRHTVKTSPFNIRRLKCNQNATLSVIDAEYSPQTCIYDCFMKDMLDTDNCTMLVKTKFRQRICNLTVILNRGLKTDRKIVKCMKLCENPCYNYHTVQTSITTTTFGTEYFLGEFLKVFDDISNRTRLQFADPRQIAEHCIFVKIYFDSTEIMISETSESTPIMTFIGNVGGQLGLWLGISMFSIIQLCYYAVLWFCQNISRIKRTSKK